MSLLLSSLKKADEQNQPAATPEAPDSPASPAAAATTPAVAAAPAAVGIAGVAAAAPALGIGSVPPADVKSSDAAIDFDTMVDDSGDDDDAPSRTSSDRQELVSATRVFRAGEKQDDGGGGFRRIVVGFVVVVLLIGSGAGAIFSGLIPGVSASSLMNLISAPENIQIVQQQNTGPVLEAISGENAALALPRPIVDVQSGIVAFAGFRNDDNVLSTPQGRRALAEQIVGFVEEAREDDLFSEEEDLQILGLEIDGEAITPEEEEVLANEIKSAALSRERKFGLDRLTPSDAILSHGIVNNAKVEIKIVQSSDPAEDAETAGDDAESTAESETAEAEEIQVKPSLDGADRQRMLHKAGRLYIGGAHADAEAVYRTVLAANATNLDALRGLALVAVATGRYQLAVATYLRILEYYPNDPVAIADLTNLHGVSNDNFYSIESALKKVLGKHTEWDSRLHFALGNLYAGNTQWLKAQKSYFNAYSGEQNNPDYAYNLAVVLDYLNKPALAARYYREALELSENAPNGFNASQVRARIAEISQ